MVISIDKKCGLSIYRKHNYSRHFQVYFFLTPLINFNQTFLEHLVLTEGILWQPNAIWKGDFYRSYLFFHVTHNGESHFHYVAGKKLKLCFVFCRVKNYILLKKTWIK